MRFISFIVVLFVTPLLPVWGFVLLCCHCMLWWRAYELILIGLCIDAYFGGIELIPYYTLAAIAVVFVGELIKPHLTFYIK